MERNRFEISELNQYYGALLTQRQREILVLHYDEDMSLSEIADTFSISRQAVLDTLRNGEKSLAEYESKLGFAAKEKITLALVNSAETALNDGNASLAQSKIVALKRELEA